MHHTKHTFIRSFTAIFAVVVGLCLPFSSSAQRADRGVQKNFAPLEFEDYGAPFYIERGRGWHWYERPLEEQVEEEEVAAPPPPPPPVKEAKKEEPKEPPKPEGPKAMSAEWLKENLPKYAMRAVDEPTDENVRAYLYLQRYAMDKAQNYATASQRVTYNDPYLDMNARKPLTDVGSQEADKYGFKVKMELLSELGRDAGLVFYFSSTCNYCQRQWPLLKAFAKKYKISVMPVSMDGSILDEMEPKSVVRNSGQAEMMGVTIFPSIYLFKPPTTFSAVSHGVATIEGMTDLVVNAAMTSGIINEQTFLRINGIHDMSIRANIKGPEAEIAIQDNKSLVDYMKKKLKEGK